jgi:hypothetical protein
MGQISDMNKKCPAYCRDAGKRMATLPAEYFFND